MILRNIAIIVLLVIGVVLLFAVLSPLPSVSPEDEEESSFSILDVGRAGDFGYVVMSYRGSPQVSILGYDSPPLKKVTILNESNAMESENFDRFVDDLKPLAQYGFSVSVSRDKILGKGIFVIPTGAIPSYVLDDLLYNITDSTVVFVGKSNLILKNGIKKQEWYSLLKEDQRRRVVLFNDTPDEFIEDGNSLFRLILENRWALKERQNLSLSGHGKHTSTIGMGDSEYLRVIYSIDQHEGLADSVQMPYSGVSVQTDPDSVFPWQKTTATFALNKTNGTAVLSVSKDGLELSNKSLIRVSDENFFLERLALEDAGDHVIKVRDNSGTIGGGIIHVKDLQISYIGSMGVAYLFNVTVDGKPVSNEKVVVHLGNSTESKSYLVSDGTLSVPAKLNRGPNTFNMEIFGTTRSIEVDFQQEGLADVYIKYGFPGLLLVLAIYFGARMSRRPVYVLRVGEAAGDIRKDVRMSAQKALDSFRSVREELGIGSSPITAHEFAVALKRHVTDGADVTEGNVEEILQNLVKRGYLESHRQYYQLKGKGDIRRNAVVRMIRDKLIESGIKFKAKGKHFITEHFEIGFFGDKFSKKAIVVVEDRHELDSIYSSLSRKQVAEVKLKLANGVLQFITVDRLEDVL